MYLRLDQLKGIPFQYLGNNVRISDKCSIYNPEKIAIADGTRIDDFAILSSGDGGIFIGKNVHIGCYSSLIGAGRIEIEDCTEISGRVSIYSSSNEFHATDFFHAEIKGLRTNIKIQDVRIMQNVVVGAGSVILPGTIIEYYARIGALSLINGRVRNNEIWAGIPAKKIRMR